MSFEYPREAELAKIKDWDYKLGFESLVTYVKFLWWMPDWGFHLSRGKAHLFHYQVIKLQLHTGGWSDNESIIGALQQNCMFWFSCFYKEIVGGHFWFDIRKEMWLPKSEK